MSFNKIFSEIIKNPLIHSPLNSEYKIIKERLLDIVRNSEFKVNGDSKEHFGPFGEIVFPYKKMGAIDSLDLFGLDEIIIFCFYFNNIGNYKEVADIGANIGLHSMLMGKCNFNVNSYEPDPIHIDLIHKNLSLNNINSVNVNKAAVSSLEGKEKFVRVLGNTTGSHILGAKDNPYGDLEYFDTDVLSAKEIFKKSDFIKMDVEGEEAKIIESTEKSDWTNTDMIVEVGSEKNKNIIFNHLEQNNINMFSQKNSWNRVDSLNDMPNSYKEGSLFISIKDEMNWDKNF